MEKRISIFFFLAWITNIFSIVNFGGFSVTLLVILPLFSIARYDNFVIYKTTTYGLLLFLTPIIIGLVIASINSISNSTLTHLLQAILSIFTFFAFATLNPINFIPVFSKISFYAIIIVSVYGIYQFFARSYNLPFDFLPVSNLQIASDFGYQRGFGKQITDLQIFTRISSFFNEPSDLGRFLLLIYPWTLLYRKSKLLLFLVIVNILLSQSLGTVFIAIIGALIWFYLNSKLSKRIMGIFVILFAFILSSITMNFSVNLEEIGSLDRIFKIVDSGWDYLVSTDRFSDTSIVVDIITQKFVTGYGIGSITYFTDNYVVSNLFFLLLLETGLIGLLFFISFLIYPLLKARIEKNPYYSLITYTSIVQVLFCFNFSLFYFLPMYAISGLTYSALRIQNKIN